MPSRVARAPVEPFIPGSPREVACSAVDRLREQRGADRQEVKNLRSRSGWGFVGETRITEVPNEFKTINLIVNNGREEDIEKLASKLGYVSAEDVRKINSSLTQPEYMTILREPLAKERVDQMCEERVLYKGSWILPNDPIARKFIDQQKR